MDGDAGRCCAGGVTLLFLASSFPALFDDARGDLMSTQPRSTTIFCGPLAVYLLPADGATTESKGFYLDVRGGVTFVEDADNVADNDNTVQTVVRVPLADDEDVDFAFRLAADLRYEFTDNIAHHGGYSFFGTEDQRLDSSFGVQFDTGFFTRNMELGLRYTI